MERFYFLIVRLTRRAVRRGTGQLLLIAVAAGVAQAQSTLFFPAAERSRASQVHGASPRLDALNPAFLGLWPDSLGDAIRNPAVAGGPGRGMAAYDNDVGAWAFQALGSLGPLGWQGGVITGAAETGPWTGFSVARGHLSMPPFPVASLGLLPTSRSWTEIRGGISLPLGARHRAGIAVTHGELGPEPVYLPYRETLEASGRGWGATVGWVAAPGVGWETEVAGGWQDGTTRGNYLYPWVDAYGGDTRRRYGWGRVGLSRGTARRWALAFEFGSRLESLGGGGALLAREFRSTEVAVAASRQWTWRRLTLGVLGRVAGGTFTDKQTEGVCTIECSTWSNTARASRWIPEAGVAAEVALGWGVRVRGSAVGRAERGVFDVPPWLASSYHVDSGRTTVVRADVDLRAGLSLAPALAPFTIDVAAPVTNTTGRWAAAVTLRF